MLKAPGTKRFKQPTSNCAFNFDVRRYTSAAETCAIDFKAYTSACSAAAVARASGDGSYMDKAGACCEAGRGYR
jgi:hypothetical protein